MNQRNIANVCLCLFAISATQVARSESWPGWRGPRGDGFSAEKTVPTRWTSEENITWKVEIPGEGHASPIVWQDRIFLATCLPDTEERVLLCLNRKSGSELWRRTVTQSRLETKHQLNSYASSTPATDGELVFATFIEVGDKLVPATNVSNTRDVSLGDMVVAAYDFSGNQRWISKPGEFVSVHGYCSCPVLFENLVIVNGDHDGQSYIVGLDRQTGKSVWKVMRPNKTRSYCTPIIRQFEGRMQMIMSGDRSVTSYDPRTGALYWHMDGPTEQFVASMVDNGKHVFLTAGFPDKHILAIDPTGNGKIDDAHIVWRSKRNCAYVPSPIVVGDYFLLTSDDGIASCYDAASGQRLWFERLGSHYSGSPVTANGLVYFTDDAGITKIVRPGPTFDLVRQNSLGEECYSSPAISDGQVFFRAKHHLVCIGPSQP